MDCSTALDSLTAVGSSSATVRSGATAAETLDRTLAEPIGAQSPSGARARVDASVEPDRGDEEGAAMTELAGLIVRTATKENLVRVRVVGLWSIRILVVLYLATCLWSVVTALVDAVVRLIAPVLTFGGFLLWMLGA
jgi:hypothetical protein